MSSTHFKGRLDPLAPTGSSFAEKAKMMRRPTPDSDAVASSDDEHVPHAPRAPLPTLGGGRRPSTGWLQDIQPNRKFSLPSTSLAGPNANANANTPGYGDAQVSTRPNGSFPWNTSSFTGGNNGSNNRMQEMLPSPTTSHFPSSHNQEGEAGIGFLLREQTSVRKTMRSQSYSIGQAELENSPIGQFSRNRPPMRHRASRPSLLGDGLSGLTQLDEYSEAGTNVSEETARPLPGYWSPEQPHKQREVNQGLLKQAAEQNARARHRAASTASPLGLSQQSRKSVGHLRNEYSDFAIDEIDDVDSAPNPNMTRRFSEYAGTGPMARGTPSRFAPQVDSYGNQQWSSSGGSVNDSLSRRHSFATYPIAANTFEPPNVSYNEEDEDDVSPLHGDDEDDQDEPQEPFDPKAYFTGYGPASRVLNSSAISAAHPAPMGSSAASTSAQNPYAVPPVLGRPGRRLYVVTFKCSRADVYYTYDNTGLEIRAGDLVITEGDRGCDLGQVSHADVSLDEAKRLKADALDEHFRWLVMFSQYSLAGSKPEGMLGALAKANGHPNINRGTLTSMGGQQDQDTKPKMIKRLAQQHEIQSLREKEGSEAKAKRLGAQKAVEHKLPMEILDAEFQADYHKLTFFYYAESYVNFNPLVVDIFKQYKIRIWMSAVNPASVVNPAGLMQIQPPSAIGPGAILPPRSNAQSAVGPGFGSSSYHQGGRRHHQVSQAQYDDGYYPFSQQLGGYQQQQYGYPGYGQYHHGYGRYGGYSGGPSGYPPVSGSSPMNYGAYYPPSSMAPNTYSSAGSYEPISTAPGYRGGYSAAPSYTSGGGYSGSYGYGGGYQTTSSTYDPAVLAAAMASMSFGNMPNSSH